MFAIQFMEEQEVFVSSTLDVGPASKARCIALAGYAPAPLSANSTDGFIGEIPAQSGMLYRQLDYLSMGNLSVRVAAGGKTTVDREFHHAKDSVAPGTPWRLGDPAKEGKRFQAEKNQWLILAAGGQDHVPNGSSFVWRAEVNTTGVALAYELPPARIECGADVASMQQYTSAATVSGYGATEGSVRMTTQTATTLYVETQTETGVLVADVEFLGKRISIGGPGQQGQFVSCYATNPGNVSLNVESQGDGNLFFVVADTVLPLFAPQTC